MKASNAEELRLEVKRKIFHLVGGVAITFSVYLLKPIWGRWIAVPMIAAILFILTLKRVETWRPMHDFLLRHFEREKDKETFPYKGALMYGIGVLAPMLLLPVNEACAVMMVLSVGDGMATLVGKTCGTRRIANKSAEGTFAFIVFAAATAMFFVPLREAAALAFAGAIVEFYVFYDDNVSIPWILTAIILLFGSI
ncbi:Uncharacterised protein [uncultured archaeon]|nr:Uncharacterised protein [uncultured archaeon]